VTADWIVPGAAAAYDVTNDTGLQRLIPARIAGTPVGNRVTVLYAENGKVQVTRATVGRLMKATEAEAKEIDRLIPREKA
jgi:hypothetical protein